MRRQRTHRISQTRANSEDQPSENSDTDQARINQQLEIVVVRSIVDQVSSRRRLKLIKNLWPRPHANSEQRELAKNPRRNSPHREAFAQIDSAAEHRVAESTRGLLAPLRSNKHQREHDQRRQDHERSAEWIYPAGFR